VWVCITAQRQSIWIGRNTVDSLAWDNQFNVQEFKRMMVSMRKWRSLSSIQFVESYSSFIIEGCQYQ